MMQVVPLLKTCFFVKFLHFFSFAEGEPERRIRMQRKYVQLCVSPNFGRLLRYSNIPGQLEEEELHSKVKPETETLAGEKF